MLLARHKIAIGVVRFYQYTFSYFFGGSCRFYPSCSDYTVQCFEDHSFTKALLLTTLRLLKCHPLSGRQGYDPVPSFYTGRPS